MSDAPHGIGTSLVIPDEQTRFLNPPARAALMQAVADFARDLLAEAGRLEAASKSSPGSPEITSSMVTDADLLIRRGYNRRPKSGLLLGSQIIAPIGGLATGALLDFGAFSNPLNVVVFVFVLTVTITATVISVLKE